ncbi:MAG: PIG-L family deacetylase, partial [Candidatus Zixiibacteriota bacterium]
MSRPKTTLQLSSRRRLNLLCLGAHSDDIEIGCGGTVLRLLEELHKVDVHWVVFSGNDTRRKESI